jgi:hypothetical protein
MDISSKEAVELYSSSNLPSSYDNFTFGINNNKKKIFLNFVFDDDIKTSESYETVLISLK